MNGETVTEAQIQDVIDIVTVADPKEPQGWRMRNGDEIKDAAIQAMREIRRLEAENLRLTRLLDEGQSLATEMADTDAEGAYLVQSALGKWADKANTEMYRQSRGD